MKPGDTLDGRYTIQQRLGAGGMGEVYLATHNFLGASRVIKVVHPHISGSEDAKDRFLREARAATKVQHQNVATLHDFASLPDGAHYMVWEYIDGENLAQRIRTRGTLPPRQAVYVAIQALRGLDAIHRAGIIHRDISPENLMITRDDEVKIIDLGVAKLEDPGAVSQTRTGIFVGKLRYASPEQLGFMPEGERVDARADLYGLAMVLVEMLTGRPPYEATSPHEYFLLHASPPKAQTVELPSEMAGSAALQAVLEKALARDRNTRFANAREFITALEEIERTLPDVRNAPTVAMPLDADATYRQRPDTLHRETVRTDAPTTPSRTPTRAGNADATLLTPLPVLEPQAAPAPAPAPAAAPPKLRAGISPAYIVGFVAIVVLVVAGVLFWPRAQREPFVSGPQTTTTATAEQTSTTTTSTQAAVLPPATATQLAETSLTVTSPPTQLSAPPPVATTTTQAPAPPVRTVTPPPVVASRDPEPAQTPAEEPESARPSNMVGVPTYIDGGDDDSTNERASEQLGAALRGTERIALRGGGMQVQLARSMREYFPDIEFAAHADVVIRFDGRLDRLGKGRKRRGAVATVEKNGRVIFRYELPDEVYRVGMSPTDSFARVLSDALQ